MFMIISRTKYFCHFGSMATRYQCQYPVYESARIIHSKSEKVFGTAFSIKKYCGKVRVIFGPFVVILGHLWSFWVVLGHSWAIMGIFGPFWVIFWSFWVIFWSFWVIVWPFLVTHEKCLAKLKKCLSAVLTR